MMFEQKLLVLLKIVSCSTLLVRSVSAEDLQNCPNVQSGTIGNSARVQCDVRQISSTFHWFNDSITGDPLVRYEKGELSGWGYDSNQYNLASDGSLIINEVNFNKTCNYIVQTFNDDHDVNGKETILFNPMAPTTPASHASSKNVSMATNIMTTGAPMNDAGLEIWVIIVIIVGALLVISLILACVICVIRKKDKANRQKLAIPNA